MTLYKPRQNDKRWAVIKYKTPQNKIKYIAATAEQALSTGLKITILGLHKDEFEANKIAKMLQNRYENENAETKAEDHEKQ